MPEFCSNKCTFIFVKMTSKKSHNNAPLFPTVQFLIKSTPTQNYSILYLRTRTLYEPHNVYI